jgi:taurine dioxygenase
MPIATDLLQAPALARAQCLHLNHHIGTELRGVTLTSLDDAGVDAVKRLLAERGVLVFRDQRMDLEQQLALGRRFGTLHVHPAFADKAHPEALRIHADADSKYAAGEAWHSDVSCDLEPPAISMLRIEVTPSAGGDTAFASMYAAFDTLSKPIQAFLLQLEARHAGDLPFRGTYKSTSKRDYPLNTHPVVRTHPVSGRRALYVNEGFTDRIQGLRGRESKALLEMLFEHVAHGVEFQCRVRWEPNTLTMWDNRCTQHFASWDYYPETRSGWRVTTTGERPYLAP